MSVINAQLKGELVKGAVCDGAGLCNLCWQYQQHTRV